MKTLAEFYDSIEQDVELNKLLKAVSKELADRNIPPIFAYNQHVSDNFLKLKSIFKTIVEEVDFLTEDTVKGEKFSQFRHALQFGENQLLAYFLDKYRLGIDEYIEGISNHKLLDSLGIKVNKAGLVELDNTMELRQHALLIPGRNVMIYPHQFMRRYYSANFVDLMSILSYLKKDGKTVELRIDPFRKSEPKYYRGIRECDYWYGPKFKTDIFTDKDGSPKRTVHITPADDTTQCLGYPLGYTVFRSDMMDVNKRQFFVEEYVPVRNPVYDYIQPRGIGSKSVIQKITHFVYDQNNDTFEHIDGSIRIFPRGEYEDIYATIPKRCPDKKIGERHKLFKVGGRLALDDIRTIVYEYFRYNSHLQEYFGDATPIPSKLQEDQH